MRQALEGDEGCFKDPCLFTEHEKLPETLKKQAGPQKETSIPTIFRCYVIYVSLRESNMIQHGFCIFVTESPWVLHISWASSYSQGSGTSMPERHDLHSTLRM